MKKGKMGIHKKIFLSFLLLICLCAGTVGMTVYHASIQALQEKIIVANVGTVAHLGKTTQQEIRQVSQMMGNLFTDVAVQNLFEMPTQTEYERLQQHLALYNIINEYSILAQFPYINTVIIYNLDGSRQEAALYDLHTDVYHERTMENDWLRQAYDMRGGVFWAGIHPLTPGAQKKDLSVFRVIKGNHYRSTVGVIYISLQTEYFTLFQKTEGSPEAGERLLLGGDGKEMLSGRDFSAVLALLKSEGRTVADCTVYTDQENVYILYDLREMGYALLNALPLSAVQGENAAVVLVTLGATTTTVLVASMLSYLISSSIMRPLKRMAKSMERVRQGHLEERLEVSGHDEVAQLSQSFNHMLAQISELFRLSGEKQKEIARAEYEAIQAQINPHFLYNALNSIRLMSMLSHNDSITNMVDALWRILKNSTGKEGDHFTFAAELQNIKDYIYLQQTVNQNKFEVSYQIDQELLDAFCPKFCIQPLVENAIIHGIRPKPGMGHVIVIAARKEETVCVQVVDNGTGIPPEKIKALLEVEENREDSVKGIGLGKLNQRIQMMFGDAYGLQIRSEPGSFTKIALLLPYLVKEKPHVSSDLGG